MMSIEERGGRRKSMLGNLVDRISDAIARRREVMKLDVGELDAIARELNLSSVEFQSLSLNPSDAPLSLESRLAHAGLSEDELAAGHGDVLRDMQRTCGLCRSKARCARDLAQGRHATLAKYCPNEETLRALANEARRNSGPSRSPTASIDADQTTRSAPVVVCQQAGPEGSRP